VIEGKNVRIAELGGGCVCCSLLGEFEAAVNEIIQRVAPDIIIVETTGLAEPEALVFNIQEALPQCRIDGVVSVIDADMLVRFPQLGHTTRLQIEGADILLLNKIDLIKSEQFEPLLAKLRDINPTATIVRAERCRVDLELLFGIGREKKVTRPEHEHQPEFESFIFTSDKNFSGDCFERFADSLPANVLRAKGFVRFQDGAQLFNFVAGRWDLEPFESAQTQLVFIGNEITAQKSSIIEALKKCEL
jgi:G3E family GTPase